MTDSTISTDISIAETGFDAVVDRAISRRALLGRGLAAGAVAAALGGTALTPLRALAAGRLGFKPVTANDMDTITVPDSYEWYAVASWGDPMWSDAPAFDGATAGTGASQERAFGDNNDGMELFVHDGRSILAVNNEYTNVELMYHARESKGPETADDVRKGKAAVGVSIVEIGETDGRWGIVKDSPCNRRITADTPMALTGPAAGHDWLKTDADPSGKAALGTLNNCGAGRTPWNTFLTCEENFDGFFASSDEGFAVPEPLKRYGGFMKDEGYGWARFDARFDVSKNPNEPNRFGYVVEIDPLNATATPKKRTALGRFKHENAALVVAASGQAVVYMGDDERGEFLYKFVSDGTYAIGGDNADLLDSGKLYVAKFNDDMTGTWIELTPASTGMASQAEVCIHTRQAASRVGATTMDRPEWVAVSPAKIEAYCALTNNKNRGVKPNAGGDATPVGGPNPRAKNDYGQIVRWMPDGADHTATGFKWDLYVVAGNPAVHADAYAGSQNVNVDNMFNSPDGLKFDSAGLLWIETDGNYSNKGDFAGQGNNQLLVGDPETGEIKRFMVGPREAEITGITWSADRQTLFIGVQHPGEKAKGGSSFPGGGGSLPRSSVIAIQRADRGLIG